MDPRGSKGFVERMPARLRGKFAAFIKEGTGKLIKVGGREYLELTADGTTVFFQAEENGLRKIPDPRV